MRFPSCSHPCLPPLPLSAGTWGCLTSGWIPRAWDGTWDKQLFKQGSLSEQRPLLVTSQTLTLDTEVPSGPGEGPQEAPVELRLLVIPQNCLVQDVGPTGCLVQGLQDQLPGKGSELEEKDSSGSPGIPAHAPASGRKEEVLLEEERQGTSVGQERFTRTS